MCTIVFHSRFLFDSDVTHSISSLCEACERCGSRKGNIRLLLKRPCRRVPQRGGVNSDSSATRRAHNPRLGLALALEIPIESRSSVTRLSRIVASAHRRVAPSHRRVVASHRRVVASSRRRVVASPRRRIVASSRRIVASRSGFFW